ncbi:histone-lysine N-methyltransferase ASHR3-like [Dorcoceras hygrometricum]|uniref:Histone-lysine N-methyltransferase ASHR3-like n=1 Tax=Dorcoceras hygrometricum TaxID=472368 RepID=A0A2Z7BJV8_9LAMI|nr:histone-lysine N-methyltransferase ASHR3-like [Dorcoceras hygrometricum]
MRAAQGHARGRDKRGAPCAIVRHRAAHIGRPTTSLLARPTPDAQHPAAQQLARVAADHRASLCAAEAISARQGRRIAAGMLPPNVAQPVRIDAPPVDNRYLLKQPRRKRNQQNDVAWPTSSYLPTDTSRLDKQCNRSLATGTRRNTQNAAFPLNQTTSLLISDWFFKPNTCRFLDHSHNCAPDASSNHYKRNYFQTQHKTSHSRHLY